MKRFTYPQFIRCQVPKQAIQLDDGSYKLPIDIKKSFHHAYVDTHGREPKKGTNPIFNEYEQLLDSSDELRFLEPGIGDDSESRIRESGKLGRGIARYILSEYYGYTWFGKIQNLIANPYQNWIVERPENGGNTPDWLISNGHADFCIGEAKGTHSLINLKSTVVKQWRNQCTNIVLKKDNVAQTAKSWLIATRFVTENHKDKPEQLIEDPFITGEPISENNYQSLNRFISNSHLSHSLFRVSNFSLGIRIQNDDYEKSRTQTLTWRPTIKEINHISFVGKPIGNFSFQFSHWYWRDILSFFQDPHFWDEYAKFNDFFNNDNWFDGIAVEVIENHLLNKFNPLEIKELNLEKYPFISLLNDGNLIIPMSLMRPDKFIIL